MAGYVETGLATVSFCSTGKKSTVAPRDVAAASRSCEKAVSLGSMVIPLAWRADKREVLARMIPVDRASIRNERI